MKLSAAALALVLAAVGLGLQGASPAFVLPRDAYLIDERIPLVLEGLPPGAQVTIDLKGGPPNNQQASSATFVADAAGRVDVAASAPVRGSYSKADAMGLFWSAKPQHAGGAAPPAETDAAAGPRWTLSASVDGRLLAETTVTRRAVDPSVRVTRVRERGLVGTLYEPAEPGRHPAMLVLTGSGGGIPPPAGPAGGLASRGYTVLALAYFNAEGLPPTLSNIPLEYFGTALQWLIARPSVDPERVGVIGASRGAELALALGVLYPTLHAVAAFEPSNVVWRGCCDRFSLVAWTFKGNPVPTGEIAVEHIQGGVFLVSGKSDGVWESASMGDAIVARLKHHQFAFPVQHLSYDHAGHAIGRPFTTTMTIDSLRHPLTGRIMPMGGTPEGTAHAREDSWRALLEFLDANLAHRRPGV
jgi:dienelactone hydrolase